jgi:glucose-1-phosphate thymidylyltransferase
MHVFIFEDDAVSRLGVLVAARPACDLTIGAASLHDSLASFGSVSRVLRPHLARYLAAIAGTRVALWGGAADQAASPPASRHGVVALLVNARVVPSRDNLCTLRSLIEAGHRTIVRDDRSIAAALLHLSADGAGPDDALVRRLHDEGPAVIEKSAMAGLPAADVQLDLLGEAHEIIGAHEETLEGALAIRLDSGRYREIRPGLFVAAGADVADQVAVRRGPVVVEAGAEIGPFACLDGPLVVGTRARVNPHAWLRAGTVLGADCRAGGEIEATVMEPFSNKPHDGFLGHSHVGSWVNLAAGTVTSNLKATYGPVRLHERQADGSRATVDTGRQFFGALVGDLARTAINTSIACGAQIGVAAAVQGSVADSVPAFTNALLGGRSTAEQACTVLARMMARRGLAPLDADSALLATLAGAG